MKPFPWILLLLGVALCTAPTTAQGRTLRFTGVPQGSPCNTPTGECVLSWTEDGITATGSIASFSEPDTVHLDAYPGIDNFGKYIDITTGSLFDPESLDLQPNGVFFTSQCTGAPGSYPSSCVVDPSQIQLEPIPYIGISGFREGSLAAQLVLYRPAGSGFETLSLEPFPLVDLLRVEALTFVDLGVEGACTELVCGHFSFDNVTLAPIPEPSLFLLVAFGLAIAGLCSAGCSLRRSPGIRDPVDRP